MRRHAVVYLIIILVLTARAVAERDYMVFRVEKPADISLLRSAGLLYLADLGVAYLAMGDGAAAGELRQSQVRFRELAAVGPGEQVYLLTARHLRDEMAQPEGLIPLGDGNHLEIAHPGWPGDPGLTSLSRVRLLPRDFPGSRPARPFTALEPVEAKPAICGMVGNVSQESLTTYISQLSGCEPVFMGGYAETLRTRYSASPMVERAAEYIRRRMEVYGIDVAYHEYAISGVDLLATDFIGPDYGWAAGSQDRIFKTADGGETWERQEGGAASIVFRGICFLDTLAGWVAGTQGRIYHTDDGGITWTGQATPTTLTLEDICFLDSLEGWVVGRSGLSLHTTDGGLEWDAIPTGTLNNLNCLHFEAADRGWACGRNGMILHWDGAAWSAQASGASQDLYDVHFVDADKGYAVGRGSTILETTDGGAHWEMLHAPPESNPYLYGVFFADTQRGWVSGLGGTVLHTEDGGATWTEQETLTLYGLMSIAFASALEGWVVGYGGTILHTTDGGASWTNQRRSLPPEDLIVWQNVVGTKPGTGSDEEVIICGHFDSISEDPYNLAPGADDNASGTAAVLEAARVLGAHSFERTIKFLCFSGEEQGLYGSGEYAAAAWGRGDDILGVINLDMIGYEDIEPEEVDLVGDGPSEWLVDFTIACAGVYVPALPVLKVIDPTYIMSDHSSFWHAGYNALLGIEDCDISYPYYHTTGDTLGNLTMDFAVHVTRMSVAVLAELAVPHPAADAPPADEKAEGLSSGMIEMRPNPVTSNTHIAFTLGRNARVEAGIYDIEGRLVLRLLDGPIAAGVCEVEWDARDRQGRDVPPGIYFVRLRVYGQVLASKLVVLR